MLRKGLVSGLVTSVLLIGGLASPAGADPSELGTQSTSTAQIQQALQEAGFYRGPVDGSYGPQTQQAVMAFRKEVGAGRSFSWSDSLWGLLNSYVKPWTPFRFNEPDRVEVNLTRQVAYLFQGGSLAQVFPVSSGNGQPYTNQFGSFSEAHTPIGDFRIQRHITGERISFLGVLWNPWYFTGGYAFHGSPSVPAFPASHGCIRLTMWDSAWLESRLSVGLPFHVWFEPAGAGPVYAPGGILPVGGPAPCPGGLCDTVAFYDPASRFYLWDQINHQHLVNAFYYGNPRDVAFAGDWDGDGVATLGLYRRSDGFVYLRNSNTEGVADISFYFGNPGDLPLAGDFDGDGKDTLAIYRPSEEKVYVMNELGQNGGGLGAAEYSYFFGNPSDVPFVGDFDGDGIDTVGLHRPSTGNVFLNNENEGGTAAVQFIFGDPGDKLIAGDWDSNGTDTIAVYRPSNGLFYVKNSNTNGGAETTLDVGVGLTGVVPISR
ncbi:MAG: L,D-transpeptidase family protein [Acidimicrobiia bacterium]